MPRLSKTDVLYNKLRDLTGSKGTSTKRGSLAYEADPKSAGGWNENVIRPTESLIFEKAVRDKADAQLYQEMTFVSSRIGSALRTLSIDSTMDSMGNKQPFTLTVNETLPAQRDKIFNAATKLITDLELGTKGKEFVYRGIHFGDNFLQPIYYNDGGAKWTLREVFSMPTYEMVVNRKDKSISQYKSDPLNSKPIDTWEHGELVRFKFWADDNRLYGRSALFDQQVNYRQYIQSLEDLAVHLRTHAPRMLKFLIGAENAAYSVHPDEVEKFRKQYEARPKALTTHIYLARGLQDAETLTGDAQGAMTMIMAVRVIEARIREDLGLGSNPADLKGQRVSDVVEANYARNINSIRMTYGSCVLDILRKGLLCEGFDDVDLDVSIPPIGETSSVVRKNASDAYQKGEISFDKYCALTSENNPDLERKKIEEDMAWKKAHDLPVFSGAGAGQPTEAKQSGGDHKAGEIRRKEQRKSGKRQASGV